MGCPFLLQQIFLAQGLNLSLLLGGWPLYYGVTGDAFPSAELSIIIQDSGLLESSETRQRGARGQARLLEAGPRAGLAPLERPCPIPEHASCPRTLLTSPSAFLPLHRCAHSPGLEPRFLILLTQSRRITPADRVSGASPSQYTLYPRGQESTAEDQSLPVACLLL